MAMTLFSKRLSLSTMLLAGLTLNPIAYNTASAKVPVFATQITKENAAALILKGPDAIGGIGDWFFTNGTICGIVSDVEHEGQFSSKGGSLVDLGFCGRADDHFSETQLLLQASQRRSLDAKRIHLQHDAKHASIIVHSERDGVQLVTRYSMRADQEQQVQISRSLRLSNNKDINGKSTSSEPFNFFSTLNFNYHSLEPFVLNSTNTAKNNGFKAEDFVSRGVSAISVAARDADTIITISPNSAETGIAYGWQLKSAQRVSDGERTSLPRFALADDSSNAMLILSDTFYIGDGSKVGWAQLPQFPLLSLSKKDVIETEEVIYVGKRGDVAAITDQIFANQTQVSGVINTHTLDFETHNPNVAVVQIYDENGAPFTHSRTNQFGHFSFNAPAGNYTIEVKASANRKLKQNIIIPPTVKEASHTIEPINLPRAAKIALPKGEAMRLLFVGINGTENPDFDNQLTDFSVHEDDGVHYAEPLSSVFLAGVDSDLNYVEISPGDYKVFAIKGPEYSLEQTAITVKPESEQTLNIKIPSRAVQSPNYIASDLHVHSGISFDNAFSEKERVRTFVAEHGEVMVSSEHDVPVDYQPRIKALGVADKITSIAAAEVTSLLPTQMNNYTGGHANVFPYTPKPLEYRRGMVNHEDKRWRDIIHQIKQQQGEDVLVQLNHARLNLELSGELPSNWEDIIENGQFLDHMGPANHPYNPNKPLHSHPNNSLIEPHEHTGARDLDIDLFEVINPGGEHNNDRIQALRKDWLSFLKQGERIVATANSDSHTAREQVAVPRTMVAMADDRISHFKQSEFIASLKAGNAYGTTGPIISVSLSGSQMGETFKGQRGQLHLKVNSADWIPVTNARIQINGETIDEYQLNSGNSHELLIPLSFEKDSFVTIEVSGPATEEYQTVYPGLEPYAFSNPIYVDYDSNNEWLAPGL